MGCGSSKLVGNGDDDGKKRNAEIENRLKSDKAASRSEVKMLLLGAGESGKSTIIKQMRLIHKGGYSMQERIGYKEIIYSNTVQSMRIMLEAMSRLDIPLADPKNGAHVSTILSYSAQIDTDDLPKDLGVAIESLWADAGLRTAFKRSREFHLNDSAAYYFDSIERIARPDYIPDDQDVLRSRVKTTGITETIFRIGELTYRMFDVGGQRSERKKWIHCFENVTAVIFLVAISEYDQVLREDESVNRLQEALALFESIIGSRWFINTSVILFMNKYDLFKEKIPYSPLEKYFPDYTGGPNVDNAADHILKKFVGLNANQNKQIYR